MLLKRVRGVVLRFLLKRPVAITVGLVMALPAVWLLVEDLPWESPITDGLGLVVGATGAAFLLAGLGGRRPDWIE